MSDKSPIFGFIGEGLYLTQLEYFTKLGKHALLMGGSKGTRLISLYNSLHVPQTLDTELPMVLDNPKLFDINWKSTVINGVVGQACHKFDIKKLPSENAKTGALFSTLMAEHTLPESEKDYDAVFEKMRNDEQVFTLGTASMTNSLSDFVFFTKDTKWYFLKLGTVIVFASDRELVEDAQTELTTYGFKNEKLYATVQNSITFIPRIFQYSSTFPDIVTSIHQGK